MIAAAYSTRYHPCRLLTFGGEKNSYCLDSFGGTLFLTRYTGWSPGERAVDFTSGVFGFIGGMEIVDHGPAFGMVTVAVSYLVLALATVLIPVSVVLLGEAPERIKRRLLGAWSIAAFVPLGGMLLLWLVSNWYSPLIRLGPPANPNVYFVRLTGRDFWIYYPPLGLLFRRVPYWLVVLVCACVWTVALLCLPNGFERKQAKRQRLGLCTRCGYDLRATPERCPECGAARIQPR
jgi:hypothetical protein